MGFLAWLNRPVVSPVTQNDVEPASVSNMEMEREINEGRGTLILERLLASMAATEIQQRMASKDAAQSVQRGE